MNRMINTSTIAMIFALASSSVNSSNLLTNEEINQKNYVVVRAWTNPLLPHVSISTVQEGDNTDTKLTRSPQNQDEDIIINHLRFNVAVEQEGEKQHDLANHNYHETFAKLPAETLPSSSPEIETLTKYISLYKGKAIEKENVAFNPDWVETYDQDRAKLGGVADVEIKLFSLNRSNINDAIENNKARVKYHENGDIYTRIFPSHHCASYTVDLLKQGRISALFPTNQQSLQDTLWASTKALSLLAGGTAAAGLTGSYLLPLITINTSVTALIGGGTAIAERGMNYVLPEMTQNVESTLSGLPRKMIEGAHALAVSSYQEKKYGHVALTPVALTIQSASDRISALTIPDVLDLVQKAREKEKVLYPQTKEWK